MLRPELISSFKQDPDRSGFVLDFDGTLSQVVEEPDDARPVSGATDVLERLAAGYRKVALLSGRRASQLASLVGARGVTYLGIYGAEEQLNGKLSQAGDAELWRGMASRLARDAEAFLLSEGIQGCVVEFKDLAVSLHYRNSPNPRAGELLTDWAATAAPRRGFESNLGRKVVELRPKGVSKAAALDRVIDESSLLYLFAAGDDTADVDALALSKARLDDHALAVGVNSLESPEELRAVSDLLVSSPEDLVALLESFLIL